jgi:hypothetical protein
MPIDTFRRAGRAGSRAGAGARTTPPGRRSSPRPALFLGVASLLILASGPPLLAHPEPDDPAPADEGSTAASAHEDLAQKLQNPFADLITFPLQNITSLGIGPEDGRANVLNLQPVVPLHVAERWNLLMRPILPVSYTSVPESQFGLGDLDFEPFLSPRKGGSVVWGVGPILGFPTATGDLLGTGKWTAGPSVAVFALKGHWAFSMILNQQWSYAGDAARERVSLLQIQPTLTYILRHGWFVLSGPLISADWTGANGQKWTLPLGGGVGRVFSVGKQKVNLQLEAYANAVRPDDGAESLVLLTGTFLFPR